MAKSISRSGDGLSRVAMDRRFRAAEYRRPLVLQELLGFNADIICLQEVDEKAFALFLQPHLDYAGL